MFISLKSLSLISSLIVLTSATPIARSSQISCKNGGTSEGNTLQWKDRHSRDVGNVAFNGQRDGQGRQNMVTLAADGSPAAPQGFNFWGCDGADSLGYPKGFLSNGSGYGQLRPANAPHHCVTVSDLKTKDARFVSAPCLSEDDDNLLTQYFYKSPNSLTFNFLGNHNSSNSPDEVYALSIGATAHKKIQVDYIGQNVNFPSDAPGVTIGFINNFA